MPRGGYRPGAGRKKGRKDDNIAAKALMVPEVQVRGEGPLARVAERLPEGYTAHELLQALYRDKSVPDDVRFVAATKAIAYEKPKPRANATQAAGGISFRFGKRVDAT